MGIGLRSARIGGAIGHDLNVGSSLVEVHCDVGADEDVRNRRNRGPGFSGRKGILLLNDTNKEDV